MKPLKEQRLTGIPISRGITIGNVKVIDLIPTNVFKKDIPQSRVNKEISKFKQAIKKLIQESERILEKYKNNSEVSFILEAEILFLKDNDMVNEIIGSIKSKRSAIYSVNKFFGNYLNAFKKSDPSFLDHKVEDINFLKQKIIQKLNQDEREFKFKKGSVIVSNILNSDEVLKLHQQGAAALVTENGSNLSHSSIISRSLDIPAIFGVKEILKKVKDNDEIILDGNIGEIIVNPEEKTNSKYLKEIENYEDQKSKCSELDELKITNDKKEEIKFFANINNLIDLKNSISLNADGVGLVRSENIITNVNHIFDKDYQTNIYSKIAESYYPKEVTIRLFDFGYDKLSLLEDSEPNPALGLRGIRYLLNDERILKLQLEAILDSSFNKNVKILIPLITTPFEIFRTREIINEIINKKANGIDKNIKIGAMIETPAAAININKIIKFVDFVSIGTNDLMQYTFAADRNNNQVAEYLNYKDSALLHMLNKIKRAAKKSNKEAVICGQLSSDIDSLKFLIKKGFTNFSIIPNSIPKLKKELVGKLKGK